MQGTCGLQAHPPSPDGALLRWLCASQSAEKCLSMSAVLLRDLQRELTSQRAWLPLYRGRAGAHLHPFRPLVNA